MPISNRVREFMGQASWIRRMFEEGERLRQVHGPDAVVDLSLGNPEVDPPPDFAAALARAAAEVAPGRHRYMANAGYLETRRAVAAKIGEESGLAVRGEDIVMSCGAAGGLNVLFRSILDPGDEVIILAPYFPEYLFYIDNHGGVPRSVRTRPDFAPDPDAIAAAIGPRTKALILNSPNNPTGRAYDEASVSAVASLLAARAPRAYLVSDEPYRRLVYGGRPAPWILGRHPRAVVVGSHSKDLAVPGERIGYIAPTPEMPEDERRELVSALTFVTRTLGFVNAPALMQRVVRTLQGVTVAPGIYEERARLLCDALERAGYELVRPEGAFYAFPRTPEPDDVAFVRRLQKRLVLTVPGSGFGAPGYFRISYCVAKERIERALPAFAEAAEEARSGR